MSKLVSRDDYQDKSCFNPDWYLSNFYDMKKCSQQHNNTKITYMELVKLFSLPIYTGQNMLDVGCGPVLDIALPGSKTFSNIVLSDYSEHNCQAVKKWVNKDMDAFDWSLQATMIAHLETSFADICKPVSGDAIELRTRTAIKEVLPIDIHQPNPLFDDRWLNYFDCLVSAYCLESACTEASFETDVRNLTALLKPGGHLLVFSGDGETSYGTNEDVNFPTYTLPLEKMISKLTEFGFEVIYKQTMQFKLFCEEYSGTDGTNGWYTLLAKYKNK